ncbi:hypothetical protein ES703_86435 [subsurface metagenome]
MAPASCRESKSTGKSRADSGRQPPEGPPIWTALNFLPLGMPLPTSNIIWRRVVPMGTSTSPVLTILPARAKTAVPGLSFVPVTVNHSTPFLIIGGMKASVLTLLTTVGFPKSPSVVMRGGRGRGVPGLPSMEAAMAVASPQTKAPDPWKSIISKLKSLPRIRLPVSLSFFACFRAILTRSTASGYSART